MKTTIRVFLAIWIFVSLSSCSEKSLSVQITNHKENVKLVVSTTDDKAQEISIDENGFGSLPLKNMKRGYAKLNYGRDSKLLWIDPNSEIIISFDGSIFDKDITFEGSTAKINDYLNNSEMNKITVSELKLEESAFLNSVDSLFNDNLRKLYEEKLPQQFVNIEEKRIKYLTYSSFSIYPQVYSRIGDNSYTPSESYINKMKELLIIDDSYLELEDYREFLMRAVPFMASREFSETNSDIDRNIEYVDKHIDSDLIREYLVYNYIYSYVERNGIDSSDKYVETFNSRVKNQEMKQSMDEVIQKWKNIQVGSPAPDFKATDIDGKEYSLKDFEGKFVYIDVWATWCGPCQGEAPFLKELEELYKDQNIYIVSLSCDSNRDAWVKQIKEENKEGIQIYLESSSFLKDFMISGIPHFILLDKEGKIINAKMTRPSNPETKEFIDNLLL